MSYSAGEVLAARLHGQGLLKPAPSVEEAVRKCIAIQTQYSQSLPVAATARAKVQSPKWFEKALAPGGPLRKTWTVRWTLHTVHEDDVPLLVSAVGPSLYRRFMRGMTNYFKLSEKAVHERQELVWNVVREGPISRKELHARVPEFQTMEATGWGWDVAGLAHEGRLYITSHMGETKFLACEPPKLLDESEAQAILLRRYLSAYGPASKRDFYMWSALSMKAVDNAFRAIETELEWFEARKDGPRYAALEGNIARGANARHRAKLLAKFDPYVMAHQDKTLFLPRGLHARVFRPAGQVEATILVNGKVGGTWRAERAGKKLGIRLEPFEPLSARVLGQIEREAERVRRALGADAVDVLQ